MHEPPRAVARCDRSRRRVAAGPGLKQRAFEERERARLLEWDDNRHVLLQEGEARFAQLEFFGQIAIERDFAQPGRFFLPLLRVGNLHRFSLVLDPSNMNNDARPV